MDISSQLAFRKKANLLSRNSLTGVAWTSRTHTNYGGFSSSGAINASMFGNTLLHYKWQAGSFYSSIVVYNPSGDTTTEYYGSGFGGSLPSQTYHSQIRLDTGTSYERLLVTGGVDSGQSARVTTSYLVDFDVVSRTSVQVTSTSIPWGGFGTNGCSIGVNKVFVVSGSFSSGDNTKSYIGEISGNSITWTFVQLPTPFLELSTKAPKCLALTDGRILLLWCKSDGSPYAYLGTVSGTTVSWVEATVNNWPMTSYSEVSILTPMFNNEFMFTLTQLAAPVENIAWRGSVSGNTVSIAGLTRSNYANLDPVFPAMRGQVPNGKLLFVDSKNTKIGAISGYAGPQALYANLSSSSSIGATLSSLSIQFDAILSSESTLTATLSSLPLFAASLSSQSTLTATLSSLPLFAASLSSQSTLTATLSNYIPVPRPVRFHADLYSESTLSASLSTQKRFAAALSSESVLSATMRTGALLAADLASSSTVTANLSAPVIFRVDLESKSSLTADLSTQVRFAANLICRSDVSAFLSIPGKQKVDECYVYISNSDLAVKVRRYG